MNKVQLIGRTTKEIELKKYGKGKDGGCYARVTLAIRAGTNADGDVMTDFVPCTLWNKTAEIAEKYVSKGDLVAFSGRVVTNSYENDEGDTVYKTEVSVSEIELIGGKKKDADDEDEDEDEKPKKKKNGKAGRKD